MSNENNNQFNNEARENHDGQFGHGQKRPYNRPKNYKYKPQHRNSYGRKPMQDRKAPADKEKNGIQVPFKAAIKNSSRRPKKPTSKLKIIPLGGLEQIGMNITAFEYEDSIVVVDCGLAFPEDDMLGIDLVIPDVTYLKENISKVKGFVITHGHEDHIGALPYVLKDVNVPVYSTKLTIALIANKLKEHNMTNTTKLKEVRHGQVINLGDFSIEFIKTNHSIQDASALAIYSPAGIVVHTGDFKVDYTPVFGDAIDLQRFAEIGRKGVLALMCDSTNAERTGFTMSERSVGHVFDNLFNEYKTNRIIIATFASNVDRVQQIINTAYRFGRKVAVEGRSMVNVITTAAELGYLRIPDQTLIEIDQVKNYPDVPVYIGESTPLRRDYVNALDTHGEDGLGESFLPEVTGYQQQISAVDFLADVLKKEKVSIIELAPMTNLARLIQKDKEAFSCIEEIVSMGGSFKSHGNCSPVAEYNYWCDPDGASLVYETLHQNGQKIHMVGLDVTRKIVLTPNLLEYMCRLNKETGEFVKKITKFYFDFHWEWEHIIGCVINDPLAVAYFINPELCKGFDSYVQIETEGISLGQSVVDSMNFYRKASNARVLTEVDVYGFFQMFLSRILDQEPEKLDILQDLIRGDLK